MKKSLVFSQLSAEVEWLWILWTCQQSVSMKVSGSMWQGIRSTMKPFNAKIPLKILTKSKKRKTQSVSLRPTLCSLSWSKTPQSNLSTNKYQLSNQSRKFQNKTNPKTSKAIKYFKNPKSKAKNQFKEK